MNRQPIYHKDTQDYRVISVPNGLWQAQRKAERPETADRTLDSGWKDIGRPATKDLALRHIYTALPRQA